MIKSPLIRKINPYGEIVLKEEDVIESMLCGFDVSDVCLEDEPALDKYERSIKEIDVDQYPILREYKPKEIEADKYLYKKSLNWNIPSEYVYLDIEKFLYDKCNTTDQRQRVSEELNEFNRRNEIDILRVMKYIVDRFREENVVWGVGRGSSVSCYCLYLIGINKIDPLKYGISYKDYFKE